MDKPFSFVVDPLARAGATGEHSPVDALVPSIVTEYAIVQGVLDDSYISTPEAVSGEPPRSNGWRRLDWVTDDRIEREFGKAEGRAKEIIVDSDDNVLHFSAYGADWIKAQGEHRHIPLHGSQAAVLTRSCIFHSPAFARCIYPDGASIGVVPNKRGLHRDVRDRAHTVIPPWKDGDHPNADER